MGGRPHEDTGTRWPSASPGEVAEDASPDSTLTSDPSLRAGETRFCRRAAPGNCSDTTHDADPRRTQRPQGTGLSGCHHWRCLWHRLCCHQKLQGANSQVKSRGAWEGSSQRDSWPPWHYSDQVPILPGPRPSAFPHANPGSAARPTASRPGGLPGRRKATAAGAALSSRPVSPSPGPWRPLPAPVLANDCCKGGHQVQTAECRKAGKWREGHLEPKTSLSLKIKKGIKSQTGISSFLSVRVSH